MFLSLPVVYVCENNLYGEYTLTSSVSGGEIRARTEAHGVTAITVNGMNVSDVRDAAGRAVDSARGGSGPTLIEALTYRYVGHSRSDPASYRPAGDSRGMEAARPDHAMSRETEESGVPEAQLDERVEAVGAELMEAEQRALAAPFPEPDAIPSELKAD